MMQCLGMSNFSMGTILGKDFPQALVHTVHSTCAFGTRAMNCMHLCLWKTLSQDCPHGEIRHLCTEISKRRTIMQATVKQPTKNSPNAFNNNQITPQRIVLRIQNPQ